MDHFGTVALPSRHHGTGLGKLMDAVRSDGNPRLGQYGTFLIFMPWPATRIGFAAQLQRGGIGEMKGIAIGLQQGIAGNPLAPMVTDEGGEATGIHISQEFQRRLEVGRRLYSEAGFMLVVFMPVQADLLHGHVLTQFLTHPGRQFQGR